MKDYAAIRQRYLRDDLPVRLGGLAANLRRIKLAANRDENRATVEGLLDESKYFIEWTAAEADIDKAAELVELQIQLARWQYKWTEIWSDPVRRHEMVEQSVRWSDRLLELSGLME
ncbi:MAG TPA: hypothetical protein VLG46_06095 [Anaerolineae bacterium]|nr:hypothetical protein [Anaerolineae bacterium]